MMLMSDPKPNDAFAWVQESWGTALVCTPLPARHLFTTRDVTLRNDTREWDAVAQSLGVRTGRLLLIRQVHETGVAVVRRGSTDAWTPPTADIIVTDDPSVAIGVRVADCAPVLLVDTTRGVVGAAHAGWRGTAKGAAARAVQALQESFGTEPAHVVAAIGPCLGPCCGEVGPEVPEAFRAAGALPEHLDRWFRPGASGKPYLDLWQANRDQLERAGVRRDAIFTSELCTKTHSNRLHSYRAERDKAGRLLAAVKCSI
jgi:hypothetical protein